MEFFNNVYGDEISPPPKSFMDMLARSPDAENPSDAKCGVLLNFWRIFISKDAGHG